MILEQELLPFGVETTTKWHGGKLFEISYDMPKMCDIDIAKNFQLATNSVIYRTLQEIDSRTSCKFKLPEILGVEVKNDPNTMDSQYDEDGKYQKPTVIVTFADGMVEKAAASEDDTFSLEQGISICYTKKLLSMLTNDNGSSAYNRTLHNAIKLYKNKQKELAEKEKSEQAVKEHRERLAAKRAKRKSKYEAKKREHEISVQAEAYARALRMVKREETM